MENYAYALVKDIKDNRSYLIQEKVIAYVPHTSIKYILTQQGDMEKRCRWINKI